MGCILYEIFTGNPPFYTNNLYQLVDMIVKGQVKWPKTMSPSFKNFLQGLLTKDPSKRLSWPQLADHEFIKSGVKSTNFIFKFEFNFKFLLSSGLDCIHNGTIDSSDVRRTAKKEAGTAESQSSPSGNLQNTFTCD